MPPHQHVDLRVLEHVADVNRAGHVRRRQRDRKTFRRIPRRPGILRAKQFFVEPGLRPALLDLLRLVGLWYFQWHASPTCEMPARWQFMNISGGELLRQIAWGASFFDGGGWKGKRGRRIEQSGHPR